MGILQPRNSYFPVSICPLPTLGCLERGPRLLRAVSLRITASSNPWHVCFVPIRGHKGPINCRLGSYCRLHRLGGSESAASPLLCDRYRLRAEYAEPQLLQKLPSDVPIAFISIPPYVDCVWYSDRRQQCVMLVDKNWAYSTSPDVPRDAVNNYQIATALRMSIRSKFVIWMTSCGTTSTWSS